jgi:hypothetical protein
MLLLGLSLWLLEGLGLRFGRGAEASRQPVE